VESAETVENVEELDADLALESELLSASMSPTDIVGSDNVSVAELSSTDTLLGASLEIDAEQYEFLPAGLMMLEGPESQSGQFVFHKSYKHDQSLPPLGSAEAKALAAFNTKQLLCRPGDRVCMTSPYGVRRGKRVHKGIDIRAPLGSPIMAFKSGVVTRAGYNRTYGYMVDIQQDDGLLARYAHMSQILTHKGARVTKGLRIGRIGSTGRSTGPHLHFELLRDNRQTNPMVFLNSLDHLVKQGDAQDYEAARKALSERGPHKKGKRSKASAGKSSGKGKNKRMPATYKVKNGDTLWDIARTYGTSVSAIQAANGGSIKNLKPGKTIRMPKR
jgi:murein DD-endopeptidase MepM/ murein hydrolase activator NlpD